MNDQRPTTPGEALECYAGEHAGDIGTAGLLAARNMDPDDFPQALWQFAVGLTRIYAGCFDQRGGAQ